MSTQTGERIRRLQQQVVNLQAALNDAREARDAAIMEGDDEGMTLGDIARWAADMSKGHVQRIITAGTIKRQREAEAALS